MRMGEISMNSGENGMGVEERSSGKDVSSSSEEVVRWEKFLPKMVLRVLLVEADDSTRQIIAALLRKCSYRVAAVPDGLKAWETLKGKPHNIDLVLTELDLPSISGYALLTLVMEHDICKNIPVIMMSSHDSISMVLKCMLKGAADFLVKPVRKNELKNLWQHVWRRQNVNNLAHKSEATSENNEACNHSSGHVASGEKTKEQREGENDAQSPSTTPYLEAESASVQNMQGFSHFKSGNAPNKHEEFVTWDSEPGISKRDNRDELHRRGWEAASAKDTYNISDLSVQGNQTSVKLMSQKGHTTLGNSRENPEITKEAHDELVEHSTKAMDLISMFDAHGEGFCGHGSIIDAKNKLEFTPQLELSLRRLTSSIQSDQGNSERLNHSDYSPFSRYGSRKASPSLSFVPASNLTKLKEDESAIGRSLTKESRENTHSYSGAVKNGQENPTNLRAEMALPANQPGMIHALGVGADHTVPGYGHLYPPIYYPQASLPQAWSPGEACCREHSPFTRSTSVNSNPEIPGLEQGGNWTDETTNHTVDQTLSEQDQVKPPEPARQSSGDGQSTCNGVADPVSSTTYESNLLKGGGSSTSDLTAEKVMAPGSLNDSSQATFDYYKGMHSHHTSQREAALMKFRMKRKDRCYEKKVRYESRKRLAEQRPRVKGQFVRQTLNEAAAFNDASDCPSTS